MDVSSEKKDPFALDAGVPEIKDSLRPVPKASDRISKRVLMVFFGFIALIFVVFMFSLDSMDKKKEVKPDDKIGVSEAQVTSGKLDELISEPGANSGGSLNQTIDDLVRPSEPIPKPVVVAGIPEPSIPPPPQEVPAIVPLTPEEQAALTEKQARLAREAQARTTGMSVKAFTTGTTNKSGELSASDLLTQALKASGSAAGFAQGPGQGAATKVDGDQDSKIDFIKNAGKADRGYHPHLPLPALSKNEIKTGSFIPMTLETSINSDLPGQITARVTEDVYDSISGCRLLIPALSKVVGRYDSKIAIGQGRMLVVWNSLIFPTGEELNMGSMQSYDTSGQAGFESEVDNHYWRLFGLTLGMSMVSSAVTLSVPQPNPSATGAPAPQTPGQTIATGLAQQFGQLGAQIMGKYMAVQPTLRNFAGERFIVMVPQTIVFAKVLRNRCVVAQSE